ncbi:MAG: hypothetical protein RML40_00145 [Bacteroidota bacterium]|nr:hypothetical protein [Candidatus Kapabacteria bacterium]MDW8218916.1 hypothetical protein [Bacteroidota bacterium]
MHTFPVKTSSRSDDNRPPIFPSWYVWYGVVLGIFVMVVVLLWWFSWAFLP